MKKYIIPGILICLGLAAFTQDSKTTDAEILTKAIANARAGLTKDAYTAVSALLKKDSNNVQYIEYTSFSLAKVWHDKEVGEDQSMPYYNKALYLAKKALKIDSNSAEAHYAYAFTIGVINEYASNKQQIANAKIMKDEIDKCLKLNPHHDGAYHLLGRWSRRMAEFNGVEKFAVKTLYGATLPDATYQDAANAFEKAYVYAPDYLLHQYELAYTYYEMNKYADAKTWLNQIINNTTYKGDDAQIVKDRSKKLLDKMN